MGRTPPISLITLAFEARAGHCRELPDAKTVFRQKTCCCSPRANLDHRRVGMIAKLRLRNAVNQVMVGLRDRNRLEPMLAALRGPGGPQRASPAALTLRSQHVCLQI